MQVPLDGLLAARPVVSTVPERQRRRVAETVRRDAERARARAGEDLIGHPKTPNARNPEHASVRVLTALLLTIGAKQKPEPLRTRYSNVAHAAATARLPLRLPFEHEAEVDVRQ